VVAVVQDEAKLLGETKEHEEDKGRRKHGPAQAAQAFHACCEIAPCEVDIPARQAAADQRQRDKQRRDEAEPRVRIHLVRDARMLIPDPMMFDGTLQPATAKERDQRHDEAAHGTAGDGAAKGMSRQARTSTNTSGSRPVCSFQQMSAASLAMRIDVQVIHLDCEADCVLERMLTGRA
jgi:hypothetical protein